MLVFTLFGYIRSFSKTPRSRPGLDSHFEWRHKGPRVSRPLICDMTLRITLLKGQFLFFFSIWGLKWQLFCWLPTFCSVYSAGEVDISDGTLPPVNEPPNATAILHQMFVNYDKRLRPMYGVEPVQLYVSMGFQSISHVVEENMVARSTIYFFNVDLHIQRWDQAGINIVSTNKLEILNTKLMKGTFFGE